MRRWFLQSWRQAGAPRSALRDAASKMKSLFRFHRPALLVAWTIGYRITGMDSIWFDVIDIYIYIKGLRPLPPTPGGSCLCETEWPTDAGAGSQSCFVACFFVLYHGNKTSKINSSKGSFEVKLLTRGTDGKAEMGRVREDHQRRSKKIREEKGSEERRCRCAKGWKSREALCVDNDLWLRRVEKWTRYTTRTLTTLTTPYDTTRHHTPLQLQPQQQLQRQYATVHATTLMLWHYATRLHDSTQQYRTRQYGTWQRIARMTPHRNDCNCTTLITRQHRYNSITLR